MKQDPLEQVLLNLLSVAPGDASEPHVDALVALKSDAAKLALDLSYSTAVFGCQEAASVRHEIEGMLYELAATMRTDVPDRIEGEGHVKVDVPPLPLDEWTVRIANSVHNIRQSLDQVAIRLGCKWFPSCTLIYTQNSGEAISAWSAVNGAGAPHKNCGKEVVGHLPPDLVELIKSVQPFQNTIDGRPELSPLEVIRRLDNHFKHGVPVVVEIVPIQLAPSVPNPRLVRTTISEEPLSEGEHVVASFKDRLPDQPLSDAPGPPIGFEARLSDGEIEVDALRYLHWMPLAFAGLVATLSAEAAKKGLL